MNIERWIIIEEDMRSVGCRGKWNDCSNIEEYVRVDMRKDEIKQTIEYYNKNAKPGSIAAKANMVKQYNENNKNDK